MALFNKPFTGRPLTGRHVLAAMIAFFGVVFAANGIMTYAALTTFSGIETPNAYQVGRDYNQTLQAAADQGARGWQVSVEEVFTPTPDGALAQVEVRVANAAGDPVEGLDGTLTFWRPVARGDDVLVRMEDRAAGLYGATAALPARGHWEVRLSLRAPGLAPYYLEKRVWAAGAS